jgi:tetraacyldisaccharide 4'-kinase
LPASRYYHDVISGRARGLWPALERGGLWAASFPYGWATRVRNRLYDCGWRHARRAPVPVVSVGNLTVGGTGKTPCVEYVAGYYQKRGLRVAVLSRGYGGRGAPNDEALVLRQNLPGVPHLQGADRAALAAHAVCTGESEVLILDDGFQHRRLARDVDIVLVDATQGWGHRHLFPRGLLRESWGGLGRAAVVVLTRCRQVPESERSRLRREVARAAPGAAVAEAEHRPEEFVRADGRPARLHHLAGRPVVAFCGVGNPDAFRATLLGLGCAPRDFRTYPDHHAYSARDVAGLAEWSRRQPRDCVVVTTQKDLVKVRQCRLAGRELWALRVRFELLSGREALEGKLDAVAAASARSRVSA